MAVDRWAGGDAYEAYVGRWSRPVADQFLARLSIPADRRWVEVGCGTGALSGAILRLAAPAAVVGVDPAPELVAHASATLRDPRVRFALGSASAVPVEDGWADAVVAGLVLNFIPDLPPALDELVRGRAWRSHRRVRLGLRRRDAAHPPVLGCRHRARPGRGSEGEVPRRGFARAPDRSARTGVILRSWSCG